VSRALTALAADPAAALRDPHRPRGRPNPGPGARLAGAPRNHGTGAAAPLVIDVDATLVTAHSDRQDAAPTFKRGFGHHPLWTFVDHGPAGSGEPLSVMGALAAPHTPGRPPGSVSPPATEPFSYVRHARKRPSPSRSTARSGVDRSSAA
jgi:hypothetical protein